MQHRIYEFVPTLLNMSSVSQMCLVFGAVVIACAVYLIRCKHFEEGLMGRGVLLISICMAAVMPIDIYVHSGQATFEFSSSTFSFALGFAVVMAWLAGKAWLASRRMRTCVARWPFAQHET